MVSGMFRTVIRRSSARVELLLFWPCWPVCPSVQPSMPSQVNRTSPKHQRRLFRQCRLQRRWLVLRSAARIFQAPGNSFSAGRFHARTAPWILPRVAIHFQAARRCSATLRSPLQTKELRIQSVLFATFAQPRFRFLMEPSPERRLLFVSA